MKKFFIFLIVIATIILGVFFALNYDNDIPIEIATKNEVKEPTKEEIIYNKAQDIISNLSLDEKIGQLFLVRFPSNAVEAVSNNYFGGYLLFEKDFKGKTKEQVQNMISEVQNASKIPLAIAVDEEGGTVVRVSSNTNLASEKFKSPSVLYNNGGFELIKEDTINKSNTLSELGINLNLAPVVDVASPSDYMYGRTLKQGVELTKEFARTVIEASKSGKVTYTLKHFPGYGHNSDTHKAGSLDKRTYEEIINTAIPPFEEGIKAGAEAILISHNVIECIDSENPASLSLKVHELLRNKLGFEGIIITDDLSMNAITGITDMYLKAILAGNNLIITSDYEKAILEVKNAINEQKITEEQINQLIIKNIIWKINNELIN